MGGDTCDLVVLAAIKKKAEQISQDKSVAAGFRGLFLISCLQVPGLMSVSSGLCCGTVS